MRNTFFSLGIFLISTVQLTTPQTTVDTTTAGWPTTDSTTAGWGSTDTTTMGWGSTDTTTMGWGSTDTTTMGWGSTDTTTMGWGSSDTTTAGWSSNDTTTGVWGSNDTTTGGWGSSETTTGGWLSNDTTTSNFGSSDTTTGGLSWGTDTTTANGMTTALESSTESSTTTTTSSTTRTSSSPSTTSRSTSSTATVSARSNTGSTIDAGTTEATNNTTTAASAAKSGNCLADFANTSITAASLRVGDKTFATWLPTNVNMMPPVSGAWSTCSTTCGYGVQWRNAESGGLEYQTCQTLSAPKCHGNSEERSRGVDLLFNPTFPLDNFMKMRCPVKRAVAAWISKVCAGSAANFSKCCPGYTFNRDPGIPYVTDDDLIDSNFASTSKKATGGCCFHVTYIINKDLSPAFCQAGGTARRKRRQTTTSPQMSQADLQNIMSDQQMYQSVNQASGGSYSLSTCLPATESCPAENPASTNNQPVDTSFWAQNQTTLIAAICSGVAAIGLFIIIFALYIYPNCCKKQKIEPIEEEPTEELRQYRHAGYIDPYEPLPSQEGPTILNIIMTRDGRDGSGRLNPSLSEEQELPPQPLPPPAPEPVFVEMNKKTETIHELLERKDSFKRQEDNNTKIAATFAKKSMFNISHRY